MAVLLTQVYLFELIIKYLVLSGLYTTSSVFDTEKVQQKSFQIKYQGEQIPTNLGNVDTGSMCVMNFFLSVNQVQELGTCVFRQMTGNNQLQIDDYLKDLNSRTSNCLQQLNEKYSKNTCSEEIHKISQSLIDYISLHLNLKSHVATSKRGILRDNNINHEGRFRSRRALTSEEGSKENCEAKLKKSFDCYRSELSELSTVLKSHQRDILTPERRDAHQHKDGCQFIQNISNKCDQLLCNPPSSPDSNQNTYNEYVRAVLPDFDIQRCDQINF